MQFKSWRFADESSGFAYDLLSNLVVPRPIAFVSTVSQTGIPNLAPFSFFTIGGTEPPSVVFCPVRGKNGYKKASLVNIEATREFVVNLVDRRMAERMNLTGINYPEGYEKWGISGFSPLESVAIEPARVAESPVQLECKMFQIVEHGSSSYVIGEVLMAHVSEELVGDSKFACFEPIARLGGTQYIDLDGGKVFEMIRPVLGSESS